SGAATDAGLTSLAGTAGASPPALASGACGLIGGRSKIVDTLTAGLGVTVANFPATQAVSGTVTAAHASLVSGTDRSGSITAAGTAQQLA
ncbi:hypothetical protein ABTM42_20275, partial [Acinetobacter baumannii]